MIGAGIIYNRDDITSEQLDQYVQMDKEHKEKTAFITRDGLFQFKVLPFGVANEPACFERLMETVLAGLQWKFCLVYLDDIIVYGATFEEHLMRLELVLQRLIDSGLIKLKPKKCTLLQEMYINLTSRGCY